MKRSFSTRTYPLVDGIWQQVQAISNRADWIGSLRKVMEIGRFRKFRPHFGWVNHIEAGVSSAAKTDRAA